MTAQAAVQKFGQAFTLHRAGRLAEAEPLYREALKAAPTHFDTLHMLGVLHLQTGRNAEALDLITRAVNANPREASALNNQGNAFRALLRLDEALASYDKAIAANAKFADALKNRGDVLQLLNKPEDAVASYNRALKLDPKNLGALINRGATLQTLDRISEALRDYDAALAIAPGHPLALKNRGDALNVQERYEDALASYQSALRSAPGLADALTGKAMALRGLKRFTEALAVIDQALAAAPQDIKALNNRGTVLRDLQRYDEAVACFDHALSLKPDYPEALVNRGTALHDAGRYTEALAAFDNALAVDPHHADAHWNRALTLLMTERYAEGWQEFEWRVKTRNITSRTDDFPQPRWDGKTPLKGALLIWGEQGVGDEILYAGMAGDLLDRGLDIVWDADARLHPLIARSFPGLRTIARATPSDTATRDRAIAAQISTASLGQFLRPDMARFPTARRSYLKANEDAAKTFRARLLRDGDERLIGVSWVSQNPAMGPQKSSRLADWAPLWQAAGPHTRFVDLQYGDTAAERAAAPVDLAHVEDLDIFHDLDGLAALIKACDLVITVSNTTTHLAGALGVPTWVMLSKGNGKLWYWGAERTASLWYPSATIFRQQTPGDWSDIIAHLAGRLAGTA